MVAVGTFHAFRVGLTMLVIPLFVFLLEAPASTVPAGAAGSWWAVGWSLRFLAALAVGCMAAPVAERIGMPSPWIIGPMIVLSILSGAGAIQASMPPPILAVAQIFLGLGIGARFTRATVAKLPRALSVGVPLLLAHSGLMAGIALVLARLFGLEAVVLILGFATGGVAEMVLTAKSMGADATMVTFYQVVRAVLGNALAGTIFDRSLAGPRDAARHKDRDRNDG